MTEDKPSTSRFQRLTSWITNKAQNEPEYIEENLSGYSLKVEADKRLKDRLQEWDEGVNLINEPITATNAKDYAFELLDIVRVVNKVVNRVAGVFATAGDKKDSRELLTYWQTIATIYESTALRVCRFWGKEDQIYVDNRSTNVTNVLNFQLDMTNIFFKYANMVIMFCFKRIDITPRHVTTIQSMMPMMPGQEGAGTTLTGSGGRTSEDQRQVRRPSGGPYPKTIENTVH